MKRWVTATALAMRDGELFRIPMCQHCQGIVGLLNPHNGLMDGNARCLTCWRAWDQATFRKVDP